MRRMRFGLYPATVTVAALLIGAGSARAQTAPPVRPLSIEDALRMAQGGSEEIEAAQAGVTRASGNQRIARSQFLPQISGTASYSRTLKSQYSGISLGGGSSTTDTTTGGSSSGGGLGSAFSRLPFGQRNTYSLGLNLQQNLYVGGRLVNNRRAADARRRSADIDLTAAAAQLMLNVTQAYYDALLSDQLVTIADSSLAQTQVILQQTELGAQVGARSEFDLLRARVARDNQIPILLQRQSDRSVAYFRLKQLLNLSLDDSLSLTSTVDAPNPRFTAVGDTSTAGRAAVRQAEENVTASEAGLQAARGERLPALALVSRFAPTAYPPDSSPFPGYNDFRSDWTVGLNLSVPLFTGGRIGGSEDIARGTRDEAKARLRQTREAAALDARLALNDVTQAQATLTSTRSTAEQAARAYNIALLRFREGISTQVELSDARLLQEQAGANQARASRNLQVARVKLALLGDLPLTSASGGAAGQAAQQQQQQQQSQSQQAGSTQSGTGAQSGVPTTGGAGAASSSNGGF